MFDDIMTHPVVQQIKETFKDYPIYLVGGAVRDYILKGEIKDWDFATPCVPDLIEELLFTAGHASFPLGDYGTQMALIHDPTHPEHRSKAEITPFRTETYQPGSRHPDIMLVSDLYTDLSRRDFTVNAMALDLHTGILHDPHHGRDDIEESVLQTVGDPRSRFKEDPLRLLRMYRFELQLGFTAEIETSEASYEKARSIMSVSTERCKTELDKILLNILPLGDKPRHRVMDSFFKSSGVGAFLLPELTTLQDIKQKGPHHQGIDALHHTLNVVSLLPADPVIRWAGLLHDIGKMSTRWDEMRDGVALSHFYGHDELGARLADGVMDRFRFSNEDRDMIRVLVRHHMEPPCLIHSGYGSKAIKKLVNRVAPYHDELLTLSKADIMAHLGAAQEHIDEIEVIRKKIPELMAGTTVLFLLPKGLGEAIMKEFGLKPGPRVGDLVDKVKEAILEEELSTEPSLEEVMEWLKRL